MTYDIIGQCSIRSTTALRCPRCGSGHAATLPCLCRPGPALTEQLGPDPLRLGDRHHPGAAPAVAPHPDVHLVEPAAVSPVLLRVSGGVSNTPIVLEAVWDSGVTVRGRIQVGVGEARSRKKHRLSQSTWLGRGAQPTQRTLHFVNKYRNVTNLCFD